MQASLGAPGDAVRAQELLGRGAAGQAAGRAEHREEGHQHVGAPLAPAADGLHQLACMMPRVGDKFTGCQARDEQASFDNIQVM